MIFGALNMSNTGIFVYPNGKKYYSVEGKLHRLDGPAVEYANGTKQWFINDNKVTELQCKLLHNIMKSKGLL